MKHFVFAILMVGLLAGSSAAQTLPDHSVFDRVLEQFVHAELVDYSALAQSRTDLDLYLEQLGRTSPSALRVATRDARLAFWINAYNACALRLVLDHYPIEKRGGVAGLANRIVGVPANSIRQIPDTWDREFCYVAHEDRSLDGIEHGIIRPLGDPRIHFAVNCASRSCPVLAGSAYKADAVSPQLDSAVMRLVNSPSHYYMEAGEQPVLRVNKILDWYKDDFGGTEGVIEFLRRYVSERDATLLADPSRVQVEYFEYDWTLNDTAVFGERH